MSDVTKVEFVNKSTSAPAGQETVTKADQSIEYELSHGRINENWILVLKSNWILRNDIKRVLLVEIAEKTNTIGNQIRLHPQTAIMFSLFDGKKRVHDVINLASDLFNQQPAAIRVFLKEEFMLASQCFTFPEKNTDYHLYNPKDFIIPQNDIDVASYRCYAPLSLTLQIADACVRNCIYCNTQRRNVSVADILTTEELLAIIDQAAEIGVLSFSIFGGEPFVRHDIPDLVRRIRKHNRFFYISSKAYISPELAYDLRDAGVEYLQISMDSADEKTADFLTGSAGFFGEIVQSIKNLHTAGIKVRVSAVITSYNVKSVPQLIVFLKNMKVDHIACVPVTRSIHKGALSNNLLIDPADALWLENEIKQIKKVEDGHTSIDFFEVPRNYLSISQEERTTVYKKRMFCTAGKAKMAVLEDGKAVLCEECPAQVEFIVGNIRKQSIMEIWNSAQVKNMILPERHKFAGTGCYDCSEFRECHEGLGRCWRDSLKAYGHIYAPTPMCPKSPSGLRII